jgi:hypothetical protein
MRRVLVALTALSLGGTASAATIEQWKAKPPKLVVHADVQTDKAIACLQEDNSMNVAVIRQDGYVDVPMTINGTRLILATVIPDGAGVRLEVRGSATGLLKRRLPCMGLPGKGGSI